MIRNAQALLTTSRRLRVRKLFLVGVLPWVALTLLVTLKAQALGALQERSQPFWPALGYTAAIYSAWALLGPVFLEIAHRILAADGSRRIRGTALVLGLPLALLVHVGLFSVVYWPVYGGAFSSPGEMIPWVLAANLDTGALAYATIVAVAVLHRRRAAAAAVQPAEAPPAALGGLWVRTGGRRQHVPLETIEWVATAGDYVEVHTGAGTMLVDSSLSALGTALPPSEFARVHRTAIVRLDKVRAVQRLGRGDALLELAGGARVRLSRRYRQALSGWAALG